MRSLASILKTESPVALARETMWRARRKWQMHRLPARLAAACPVNFKPVGFYKPDVSAVGEESRRLILDYSNRLLEGRFSIFGYEEAQLGFPPAWNVDFVSGFAWLSAPSADVNVLRFDGSDVKVPWELSRLQFLPVLGKAWALTHDARYRTAATRLVDDWIEQNPVGLGLNWRLAIEASLRAMSLAMLLELLWPFSAGERAWLGRVASSLWQHLLFIEAHSEFSHLLRGNHYLSNVFGLAGLSCFLHGPGMPRRLARYTRLLQDEILFQTYADGGNFEASTSYHAFATQMFTNSLLTFRARGIAVDPAFESRLGQMYSWMAALCDDVGRLPALGDCDDGRVELLSDDLRRSRLPPGERDSLILAGLLGIGAALFNLRGGWKGTDAAWYGLGDVRSEKSFAATRPSGVKSAGAPVSAPSCSGVVVFPQSGLARAQVGSAALIFCAMPNGIGGKGSHTHNDKLAFILRLGGRELFCDSGTYVYTRDVKARNAFRSTAAHNTVRVASLEQNSIFPEPLSAFIVGNEAGVFPIAVSEFPGGVRMQAFHSGFCRIGVTHSRALQLFNDGRLWIEDDLSGDGEFPVELFFQVGPEWRIESLSAGDIASENACSCRLQGLAPVALEWSATAPLRVEAMPSRISRAYGNAIPASRLRVFTRAALPLRITTKVSWPS